MPIDLFKNLQNFGSQIANRSAIGQITSNPLWMAVIITAVMLLVFYTVGISKGVTFKLIFYSLLSCILLLIVHDTMIQEQYKEKYEDQTGAELVNQIQDTIPDLQPRSNMEKVRQSYMNNMPNPTNEVISPDELLKLVNDDY